jgi:putative intracellular protease/amidase
MNPTFLGAGIALFWPLLAQSLLGCSLPPGGPDRDGLRRDGPARGLSAWLLSRSTPVVNAFNTSLRLPFVPDLLAIQRRGAVLAWALSELPVVITVLSLVVRWARADQSLPEPACLEWISARPDTTRRPTPTSSEPVTPRTADSPTPTQCGDAEAVAPTRRVDVQIAILLYNRFTALDAVGPYEVLSRLPHAEVVFVGEQSGPIVNDLGSMRLVADAVLANVPSPDVVLVPGGPGQADQMADGPVHEWLRAADTTSTWTTSVCTGSLILASAGLLTGRRATSHWLALEQLPRFDVEPAGERVVFDDKYVTAAGVSSGIDMALALTGRVAGDAVAKAIQLSIEYDPQPPYDTGSPGKAPRELVGRLRERSRFVLTG